MKWLVALALVTGSSLASAAPKTGEAKVSFDTGVAAYSKGDFAAAAEALGKSYELEADVETLFAWAQAERKLEHCEKATELYAKLLDADLPAANKAVVRQKFDECQAILGAQAAQPPKPVVVAPRPPAPVEPVPPPPHETSRAWWKDPVGGTLVGLGVVGLGVGGVFLVQARSADKDKDSSPDYAEFQRLADRADSRGKLGVSVVIGGGVLATAGIVWYATHGSSSSPPTTVTGWLGSDGGGLAAIGAF
jgi:hypothetical protein